MVLIRLGTTGVRNTSLLSPEGRSGLKGVLFTCESLVGLERQLRLFLKGPINTFRVVVTSFILIYI